MSDEMIVEDMTTYNTLLHSNSVGDVSYDEQMLNERLFLEAVSPHLKCSICLDVMSQPVQCQSGHSFCKKCIHQVLRNKKVCPICRIHMLESHLVINRAVEGVIQDLILKCPTTLDTLTDSDSDSFADPEDIRQSESSERKACGDIDYSEIRSFHSNSSSRRHPHSNSRRCLWTGHVHACKAHLLVCPYARVHCPHPHCKVSLPREDLMAHSVTCGTSPALFFHLYTLVRCGSQDAWRQLQDHASSHSSPTTHPLAVAYAALVHIQSQISTIPRNLTVARQLLTPDVLAYLKEHTERDGDRKISLHKDTDSDTDTENNEGSRYRDRYRFMCDVDNSEISSSPSSPRPHASFILATLLQEGVGFPTRSPKRAVSLFKAAADMGHAGAQCALGLCYDTGTGVTADISKAVACYRLSAEQGYAPALVNLGMCYYHGDGVTQNRATAIDYYEEAAILGHATGQFNLGVCYSSGEVCGCKAGEDVGVRWVRRAALQGYEPALEYLEKYQLSLYH